MKIILAILVLLSLQGTSYALDEALIKQRRIDSLYRGINLMASDTVVYQKKLAIAERLLKMAYTDTDKRNAKTRINEINLVLASLQRRIELATVELKLTKK